MWDGKTSTKALRSLIKSLGESTSRWVTRTRRTLRKDSGGEQTTFGRFWSSMMENARRRSQYICNVESFFVNMRTDFKIGDLPIQT